MCFSLLFIPVWSIIDLNNLPRQSQKGSATMNRIYDFLKNCGTFYIATDDKGQPRVRPFGAVCLFEEGLYIVTNNQKAVYRQMMENPRIEISGMYDNKWIRLSGTVELDDRREARAAMLEANPSLGRMYSADDGLMVVFRFVHGTAAFCSFTDPTEEVAF